MKSVQAVITRKVLYPSHHLAWCYCIHVMWWIWWELHCDLNLKATGGTRLQLVAFSLTITKNGHVDQFWLTWKKGLQSQFAVWSLFIVYYSIIVLFLNIAQIKVSTLFTLISRHWPIQTDFRYVWCTLQYRLYAIGCLTNLKTVYICTFRIRHLMINVYTFIQLLVFAVCLAEA